MGVDNIPLRPSTKRMNSTKDLVEDVLNGPCTVNDAHEMDPDQVFSIYVTSFGDVFKTGKACGLSAQRVTEMAEAGGWLARIRDVIDLRKLDQSDDVARAMNRASNFIQASRMRLFVERITRQLSEVPDDKLLDAFLIKKVTKEGAEIVTGISFRILADLAACLEKTHWMLYQSLEDGVPERQARRKEAKDASPAETDDVHAKIARAMAGMSEQPAQVATRDHEIISTPTIEEASQGDRDKMSQCAKMAQ